MNYQDLTEGEKFLFNEIEGLFVKSRLNIFSFIKVLGILINKHKRALKC